MGGTIKKKQNCPNCPVCPTVSERLYKIPIS